MSPNPRRPDVAEINYADAAIVAAAAIAIVTITAAAAVAVVVVDAAAVRNPAVVAAAAGIAAIAATDSNALPAFVGKNNAAAAAGGVYRHAFRDLCCCPGRGRYSDLHTPRFALPGYSEA